MSIGARRTLTSFLTAFVSVGPTVFDQADRGQRVFVNWQANLDGALPIFLTRQTTLSLAAQQNVVDTVGQVGNVGLVLSQSVTLSLNHAASRDLGVRLFVGYSRTELLENFGTSESVRGEKDNFWNAGGTVSYALTRICN